MPNFVTLTKSNNLHLNILFIGLLIYVIYHAVARGSIKWSKEFLSETWNFLRQSVLGIRGVTCALFNDSHSAVYNLIMDTLSRVKDTPRTIWLGYFSIIYVNDPDDLQVILNSEHTLEKSSFYKFTYEAAGHGIITAPVAKWKRHRRFLTPLFNIRNLKNYCSTFNVRSKEIVSKLKRHCDTHEYFDVWDIVSFATYSMLFDVAFGSGTKCVTDEEKIKLSQSVVEITNIVGNRCTQLWQHPNFIYKTYLHVTGRIKYFDFVNSKTNEILEEIRTNIKKTGETSQDTGSNSVVENLVRLSEEGIAYTNREDICAEANTIIAAGSETNALTICFTLLMLSMHPDVQDRAYREIMDILRDEGGDIHYDDVEKMTYLNQCLNETLRMFPPLPFYGRQSTNNLKLSKGFYVPIGSHILIPAIVVHRNPEIYNNPDIWNPDRFSLEELAKQHKYSFLAFSGGQRGCMGKLYAQTEMKIVVATILKHYRLVSDAKMKDVKLKIGTVIRNANGYTMKFYQRKMKAA